MNLTWSSVELTLVKPEHNVWLMSIWLECEHPELNDCKNKILVFAVHFTGRVHDLVWYKFRVSLAELGIWHIKFIAHNNALLMLINDSVANYQYCRFVDLQATKLSSWWLENWLLNTGCQQQQHLMMMMIIIMHRTHISFNRRRDAWSDEWVCIPVFWWPLQKNWRHLRWQPRNIFQRLSVTIQRFNAAFYGDTFVLHDNSDL